MKYFFGYLFLFLAFVFLMLGIAQPDMLLSGLGEMEPAQPGPDLRTAAEKEQDDVARLERRLAWLEREFDLLTVRVDASARLTALEATVAALVKVLEVRL